MNSAVMVVGADGTGLKQIALSARAPAWSPDGRRLAYESGVSAYFDAGSVTIARPRRIGARSGEARELDERLRAEADNARIWAGLHNRFSVQAGSLLGREVADYDLDHAFTTGG